MSLIKGAVFKFMPRRWLLYFKAARYIRHVGRFSEADEPELKVVKHLVNLGDTVVDVGANVGWYTHYLSRLIGEKGRVISLEPIPETFWLLSVCAKWHRLSNATLVNAGASEEDKVGVMEVPFYDFGGENFYMAHVVDENIGGVRLQKQVRLTTLDSELQELADNVTFVKCDVEGHELAVVKGAVGLIGQEKAAWLMEVSRASDPDIEGTHSWQIFKLFKAHRYTPWWFDGQRLRQRKIGDRALNYFFLLPQHIALLEHCPLTLDRQ